MRLLSLWSSGPCGSTLIIYVVGSTKMADDKELEWGWRLWGGGISRQRESCVGVRCQGAEIDGLDAGSASTPRWTGRTGMAWSGGGRYAVLPAAPCRGERGLGAEKEKEGGKYRLASTFPFPLVWRSVSSGICWTRN